jgi:hypothetical protein
MSSDHSVAFLFAVSASESKNGADQTLESRGATVEYCLKRWRSSDDFLERVLQLGCTRLLIVASPRAFLSSMMQFLA